MLFVRFSLRVVLLLVLVRSTVSVAQPSSVFPGAVPVHFTSAGRDFVLATQGKATPLVVETAASPTVSLVASTFAGDIARVTGARPQVDTALPQHAPTIVLVGVVGQSRLLEQLNSKGKLHTAQLRGKWESAVVATVDRPFPGIGRALVIAGSDRRGAAYALFGLSRSMGVSPWNWWADVPVPHHDAVYVAAGTWLQHEPSVPYRGIFLNDEDWGLRPWAAAKMDPELHNVGPHTYARIFELLLRLRANTLWPAMHPGTLAFNAVPENAQLADRWGIVMGSSHSEALLRNNVGEWDETRNGPWNYQTNRPAIDAYWDKRLAENGKYENFYTVGMRGVHDTGLEASGSTEVKAHLVEDVMRSQRDLLARHVNPDVTKVPEVIWLYKESLELYRAGMKVPDDVTLGWTDDNYGYIRQLPTAAEQRRAGGSGIYYHVSYWGFPHDYLWLCSTPPALIREEMTKAYDRNARRYWVLNVGDLKPAELDIDYFMQLGWDEPALAHTEQTSFLQRWLAEQLSPATAREAASILGEYYHLNFIRKPEFMGFNGYNDAIKRTEFNPLAWGDQNRTREQQWDALAARVRTLESQISTGDRDAFFELVAYPVLGSAAQNRKFLATDRAFLHAAQHKPTEADAREAQDAYNEIQQLTAQYNSLAGGKWAGIMSAAPRDRQVFRMPAMPDPNTPSPLPSSWGAGTASSAKAVPAPRGSFVEQSAILSFGADHFSRTSDQGWHMLADIGVDRMVVGHGAVNDPGATDTAQAPWLDYDFTSASSGAATLALDLLPTFPLDPEHRQRFAVQIDGGTMHRGDAAGAGEWQENAAPAWERNVLRNFARFEIPLGTLAAGHHTMRVYALDSSVMLEHLTIALPGAAPAYPTPPETRAP